VALLLALEQLWGLKHKTIVAPKLTTMPRKTMKLSLRCRENIMTYDNSEKTGEPEESSGGAWPPSIERDVLPADQQRAIPDPPGRDGWNDFMLGSLVPPCAFFAFFVLGINFGNNWRALDSLAAVALLGFTIPYLAGFTPLSLIRPVRRRSNFHLAKGAWTGTALVVVAILVLRAHAVDSPTDSCKCAYVGNTISIVVAPQRLPY